MSSQALNERLVGHLKTLHLPAIRESFEDEAVRATQESLSYEQYLFELADQEVQMRRTNRIARFLRESRLPLEKALDTFDLKRLPRKLAAQVRMLLEGSFLDRKENVLAFGNPGSGKTHLLCAIARELVENGRRVLFTPCALLVQDLLVAKRDLRLARVLKKLGRYDALLIDDIGYVQQSREEMEVLFSLLADRYERTSVIISSNLPFSKWETIFKDPMTTAAVIDRLVHHSVILELNLPSYRLEQSEKHRTAAVKNEAAEQAGERNPPSTTGRSRKRGPQRRQERRTKASEGQGTTPSKR
jgi:DNA replication protein DnaC